MLLTHEMSHQVYFKNATLDRFSMSDKKLSIFLGSTLPNSIKFVLLCYYTYLAKSNDLPPLKPQNQKFYFECGQKTL